MKSVSTVTVEAHDFVPRDFVGGDAALDFINTVTGRDDSPRDWLDGYGRLLEWATLAQLLPERHLRALARNARSDPAAASAALDRAKALRECLFAVVTAVISGTAPSKEALGVLRKHWIAATDAHELRFGDGRVVPELRTDAIDLDLIAAMVAYRAVEHVLPLPTQKLRLCEGPNCSWLFIDSSKAGRRRWCDMAVCGNAAKARRFYAKRTN